MKFCPDVKLVMITVFMTAGLFVVISAGNCFYLLIFTKKSLKLMLGITKLMFLDSLILSI